MKTRSRVAIFLVPLVLACGKRPEADASPASDSGPVVVVATLPEPFQLTADQQSGRIIYETVCWTCHGVAGRGDGPAVKSGSTPAPPSFYGESLAGVSSDELERRFRAELEGRGQNHPHMRYVAAIVRPERFKEALAYVPALTYPPEIPGSAMAGREGYRTHCLGCHGIAGQGDGPAAQALTTKPANFPADTLLAQGNYDGVFGRIKEGGVVHGTEMPAWGLLMTDAEIWDLVAYLATFQGKGLSSPPGM